METASALQEPEVDLCVMPAVTENYSALLAERYRKVECEFR